MVGFRGFGFRGFYKPQNKVEGSVTKVFSGLSIASSISSYTVNC